MSKRPRTWLVSSVVLALVLATACRSTGTPGAGAEPILLAAPIDGDAGLERSIRLLDPLFVVEGGVPVARFSLTTVEGGDVDVYFHVEWFDPSNSPIDTRPQMWFPAHLVHGELLPVRAIAPVGQARSFRLRFQRPEAVR